MSESVAKKQKLDNNPPPIIFKLPDMRVDTRLNVLNQEFQVHSALLNIHSAFFRKFLDLPEKQNAVQDGFKYSWVTQIDEDGKGWHLVSTNNYVSTSLSMD